MCFLNKSPHVCNGCKLYLKYKKVKIKYHAWSAIKKHNVIQKVSRIDKGLLDCCNLDLRNKVSRIRYGSILYSYLYFLWNQHVENNYILLRWLIKKGFDITELSNKDIFNIINRLNNYLSSSKGYKTPLQLLEETLRSKILEI